MKNELEQTVEVEKRGIWTERREMMELCVYIALLMHKNIYRLHSQQSNH